MRITRLLCGVMGHGILELIRMARGAGARRAGGRTRNSSSDARLGGHTALQGKARVSAVGGVFP